MQFTKVEEKQLRKLGFVHATSNACELTLYINLGTVAKLRKRLRFKKVNRLLAKRVDRIVWVEFMGAKCIELYKLAGSFRTGVVQSPISIVQYIIGAGDMYRASDAYWRNTSIGKL